MMHDGVPHLEAGHKPAVYCADDNALVTEALRVQVERTHEFEWMGCAEDAGALLKQIEEKGCPDLVLLDIDMPGRDPFDAIGALSDLCGDIRVLMYTGIVRRDLIDRAVEAGAWGYVAKSDGEEALFEAMRKVLDGQFALSPEVQAAYGA